MSTSTFRLPGAWLILLMLAPLTAKGVNVADEALRSFNFNHFATTSSFSHIRVNDLYRSEGGCLWISTPWSLDCFDGHQTLSFQVSLPGHEASEVLYARNYKADTVIVKLSTGIALFSIKTWQWSPAQEFFKKHGADFEVEHFDVTDDKTLWMGNRSKCLAYNNYGQTSSMTMPVSDARVTALHFTAQRGLALFSNGQIAICGAPNGAERSATNILQSPLKRGGRCVYADRAGDIWAISLSGDSLWHYELSGKGWSLVNQLIETNGERLANLNQLIEDSDGMLWLASENRGLVAYDRYNNKVYHIRKSSSQTNGLASDLCSTIFADAEGNIFVGHPISGLSVYHPGAFSFDALKTNPIEYRAQVVDARCMAESNTGWIYIGTTGNGLWKVFPSTRETAPAPSAGMGVITRIAVIPAVSVWFGGPACGLVRWDYNSETIHRYLHRKDVPEVMARSEITALVKDSETRLWIASGRDLMCAAAIDDLGRPVNHHETKLDGSISFMRAIADGGVMVVTIDGLRWATVIDGEIHVSKVKVNAPPGFNPTDACLDSRGLLWLTSREGIYVAPWTPFNAAELKRIDVGIDEPVYSVVEDAVGSVLVTTSKHVYSITANQTGLDTPYSIAVRRYDESDGLIDGLLNPRAMIKLTNGDVWIGGEKGVSIYNARRTMPLLPPNSVIFTSLTIANKLVWPGEEHNGVVPLDNALRFVRELKLAINTRGARLHFSALNYASPVGSEYKYQIDGIHEQPISTQQPWIDISGLPAGTHNLWVWAINSDGERSLVPALMRLHIIAHWWQDQEIVFWALLLGLLTLGILTFIALRNHRRRQLAALEQMADQAHQQPSGADQADVLRSEMLISSLSGMRALLTAAQGDNEDNDETTLSHNTTVDDHTALTIRALQRLRKGNSVAGILLDKIESCHNRNNDPEEPTFLRQDLVGFVRRICVRLDEAAESYGTLSFASQEAELVLPFDAPMMRRVIVSLIVKAYIENYGTGFVEIWVGQRDEFPGKAIVSLTTTWHSASEESQTAEQTYGADVQAVVAEGVKLHEGEVLQHILDDGRAVILLTFPL